MANEEIRHAEVRSELRQLYRRSAAARHPLVIKEIEAEISRLESDAAAILLRVLA